MNNEDLGIKETSPLRVFFTSLFILLIVGITAGLYYFYFYQEPVKLKTVNIELGDSLPTSIDYYLKSSSDKNYKLDISNIKVDVNGNTTIPGEYSYNIITRKNSFKGKLLVVDTTPPVVKLHQLTVGLNEDFEPEDFIESCYDLSGICNVFYKKDSDEKLSLKEGRYTVTLEIKDHFGNTATKKTELIVDKNASLNLVKSSDNEVFAVYPINANWNETYTIKFDKGMLEETKEFEAQIFSITNKDFTSLFEEKIINQTLHNIYNKYNYVIGLSLKIELENGETIYLTESELKEITE